MNVCHTPNSHMKCIYAYKFKRFVEEIKVLGQLPQQSLEMIIYKSCNNLLICLNAIDNFFCKLQYCIVLLDGNKNHSIVNI